MARFDKIFPAMDARVRQRKFNIENGLADHDADNEGFFLCFFFLLVNVMVGRSDVLSELFF